MMTIPAINHNPLMFPHGNCAVVGLYVYLRFPDIFSG